VRRKGKRRNDETETREYNSDEVETLTQRANELLDELHSVLGEMTNRLRGVAGDEAS
jgi:hypothetical protein